MGVGRHLDAMADRIEGTLLVHGVRGRVWGGQVGHRLVRYQLTMPAGVPVRKVAGLAEELALALAVPHVRIVRENGAIMVEVPRLEAPRSFGLADVLQRLDGQQLAALTAVLGIDELGRPLRLCLANPAVVHVLVAGTTGSGKTVLLRSMLLSMATYMPRRDLALMLIDPRGQGLEPLARLPHVIDHMIDDVDEAAVALNWLVGEMERRDKERYRLPYIVVAIDELADLLDAAGKPVEGAMRRLAQRGRGAGIHLLAGTQKPASTVIETVTRANFPARIVGRVVSSDDARVAAGISGTGAELLQGQGDFLLVLGGEVRRFQAPLAGREDLALALGLHIRRA